MRRKKKLREKEKVENAENQSNQSNTKSFKIPKKSQSQILEEKLQPEEKREPVRIKRSAQCGNFRNLLSPKRFFVKLTI